MKYIMIAALTLCTEISAAAFLEEMATKAKTSLSRIAEKYNIRKPTLITADRPSWLKSVDEKYTGPLQDTEKAMFAKKARPLDEINTHTNTYLYNNEAQIQEIKGQLATIKKRIDDNTAQLKNADAVTRQSLQDQINQDQRTLLQLRINGTQLQINGLQEFSNALTLRERYMNQLYNTNKRAYYLLSERDKLTDTASAKLAQKNYTRVLELQSNITQYTRQLKKLK